MPSSRIKCLRTCPDNNFGDKIRVTYVTRSSKKRSRDDNDAAAADDDNNHPRTSDNIQSPSIIVFSSHVDKTNNPLIISNLLDDYNDAPSKTTLADI